MVPCRLAHPNLHYFSGNDIICVDCIRPRHPWHKPAMPSHDSFKNAPTYPVIVTPNPMATKQVREASKNA